MATVQPSIDILHFIMRQQLNFIEDEAANIRLRLVPLQMLYNEFLHEAGGPRHELITQYKAIDADRLFDLDGRAHIIRGILTCMGANIPSRPSQPSSLPMPHLI